MPVQSTTTQVLAVHITIWIIASFAEVITVVQAQYDFHLTMTDRVDGGQEVVEDGREGIQDQEESVLCLTLDFRYRFCQHS